MDDINLCRECMFYSDGKCTGYMCDENKTKEVNPHEMACSRFYNPKIPISKRSALEWHRLMWEWIADNVEVLKLHTSIEIKVIFLAKYFGVAGLEIESYCFCCEYNLRDNCSRCPIEWAGKDCMDGEYAEFKTEITENHNYSKASEIARKIANLPER